MWRYLGFCAGGMVLLSLLSSYARADITEFELPQPNGYPGKIIIGPDGNLWFAENFTGNRIGRFKLAASTITEFALPNPNSDPRGLAVGSDGNLWFTELKGNRIGTITVDGTITEFDLPNPNSAPSGGTQGLDGNYWFTENSGN